MDIQGWLQGTADRAPPIPSDELVALTFGHPSPGGEATTTIRHRRKRKQPASDSSIIALQRRNEHRGKVGDRPAHGARDRLSDGSVPQSNSASRHRRPVSQVHGTDGNIRPPDPKPYERRARHKTKADCYEPKKQKGRDRKQRDDAGEQEPKHKRGRAHRGGDGKRTEGLVQGFRLKNGPSNTRLTLKPDTTAGLFKHGRASAQTNGRSNGLPDLAFNELKFLRNPDEHQDMHQEDETTHKMSNQERKRAMEREEVSAYFSQRTAHDRVPEPELHRMKQKGKTQMMHANPTQHHAITKEGSSPVPVDEELPAVPYLGFGSKGNVNHSSNTHPSATTYFTWSESAVGPDVREPNAQSTIQQGQSLASEGVRTRRPESDPKARLPSVASKQKAHGKSSNILTGQWKPSRRARGPAIVEVYVEPSNAGPRPSTGLQIPHDKTSLSLPTKPAALSEETRQSRPVNEQCLSSDASSFNKSDILKVRGRLETLVHEVPLYDHSAGPPHNDKENAQPLSSSPTTKLLRTAQEAMESNRNSSPAQSSRDTQQRHHHVVQIENHHRSPLIAIPNHQLVPLYSREWTGDGTSRLPVHASSPVQGHHCNEQVRQHLEAAPADEFNCEDNEMLDNQMPFSPQVNGTMDDPFTFRPHVDESIDGRLTSRTQVNGYEDSRFGQASVHAYAAPAANSDMQSTSFRYDRPSTQPRGIPWSRGGISTSFRNTSPAAIPTHRGPSIEEDHVGDRDFEDGLEGFWRPHRLY